MRDGTAGHANTVQFWLETEKELAAEKDDTSGRGNSQDPDRHTEIRRPHSVTL